MSSPFKDQLAQIAAKAGEAATAVAVTKALAEPAPASTVPVGAGADPEVRAVVKGLFGGTPSLPARVPYGTTGALRQSGSYSIARAAGFALGILPAEMCKEEIQTHTVMKGLYAGSHLGFEPRSFLVPFASGYLPTGYGDSPYQTDPNKVSAVNEIREKMAASVDQGGFDEAYERRKALGTIDDSAGGSFRAAPQLGEIIDLQRTAEVFSRCGAREVPLPPNGQISYPRLKNAATAYAVGEGAALTEANATTGSLLLQAKKYAVLSKINSELFKFSNSAVEAMLRMDMAQTAARKLDADMLYGTGGTAIKGLRTYSTQTSWSQGTSDKVMLYTSAGAATDGDTLQPEDIEGMLGILPDGVEPTAWVMRRVMLSKLATRRVGSGYAANDGKGPFAFDITRTTAEGTGRRPFLAGVKVVDSQTVTATLAKGSSGSVLTEILAGDFGDWLIGRAGVMEFLATNQGDTAFVNDQVWLRGIQHIDAGPRNASSFVACTSLLVA